MERAYRLFVQVREGKGHTGYANVPFSVQQPGSLPVLTKSPGRRIIVVVGCVSKGFGKGAIHHATDGEPQENASSSRAGNAVYICPAGGGAA